MIYFAYKTTNLCNGKFYIGIHRTSNIDDGYLGSGTRLLEDLKKYGRENFSREILKTFSSEKEMILYEEQIVDAEFIKSPDNYNIMPGGKFGSFERNGLSFKGRRHTKEAIEKIKKARNSRPDISEETRKKLSENNFSKRDPERQREHARKAASKPKTKEHCRRISEAIRRKNSGKLSRMQVLEIFERTDKTYKGLAEEYEISKEMVAAIKKKRTYRWVHDKDL